MHSTGSVSYVYDDVADLAETVCSAVEPQDKFARRDMCWKWGCGLLVLEERAEEVDEKELEEHAAGF